MKIYWKEATIWDTVRNIKLYSNITKGGYEETYWKKKEWKIYINVDKNEKETI